MQMERKRDNHHQGQNRSKDNKRQVKMAKNHQTRAGCQTFITMMKKNTFLIRNYHHKERKKLSSVKMTFLSRITPLLKTYLFPLRLDCFPCFVTNILILLAVVPVVFLLPRCSFFSLYFPKNSLFITSG